MSLSFDISRFSRLSRRQKHSTPRAIAIKPRGTPIPIPILAPVDGEDADPGVEGLVGAGLELEGSALVAETACVVFEPSLFVAVVVVSADVTEFEESAAVELGGEVTDAAVVELPITPMMVNALSSAAKETVALELESQVLPLWHASPPQQNVLAVSH